MAKITVSAFIPTSRTLRGVDPTGETWVMITPPGYAEEMERGRMLSKRSYSYDESGLPITLVDVNTRMLFAEEIWLSYHSTNMEVDMPTKDEDGNDVIVTITFLPRTKTTRGVFMGKLLQLPPPFVYEWRSAVVDVIRSWATPF